MILQPRAIKGHPGYASGLGPLGDQLADTGCSLLLAALLTAQLLVQGRGTGKDAGPVRGNDLGVDVTWRPVDTQPDHAPLPHLEARTTCPPQSLLLLHRCHFQILLLGLFATNLLVSEIGRASCRERG